MKLTYIFKFLFLAHNGKLRLSFLFPITGILVGSYIIFITYSIMNGLAISIDNKLGSFDYKYSSGETDISIDYYNDYENFGAENICLLKSDDYEKIVKIKYYNNMNHYYDKIESFLIYDNAVDVDKGIIIGDELALALNAGIGDSISILLPSQINLSTN